MTATPMFSTMIVDAVAFAHSQLAPSRGAPSDFVVAMPPTYGSTNDFTSSHDPERTARAGPPFVIDDVGCGLDPAPVVDPPLHAVAKRL
jgi:hypothetical protein